MKRFLKDVVAALFVGAVLIALAMFLGQPADNDPSSTDLTPAQEAPER